MKATTTIPSNNLNNLDHPVSRQLMDIYERMFRAFGPQEWWPGETPFEVCIGAILTQNTNWKNVEKAISNLKEHGLLNPVALHEIPAETLAGQIRPAGYYNLKSRRIKAFVDMLFKHFNGKLESMFDVEHDTLRTLLLSVNGIGPETADSILLYALNKPSFVVDAYTMRVLNRHNLLDGEADYDLVRRMFMDYLPCDVSLYNEYHALIVRLGKQLCTRRAPRCSKCPLEGL